MSDDEPNFTIPPENEIVTNPKVMLSVEIAKLTGKNHQHVMRDIRVIIEQLQKDSPNFDSGFKSSTYLAGNGEYEKCYELDYEATMVVMSLKKKLQCPCNHQAKHRRPRS